MRYKNLSKKILDNSIVCTYVCMSVCTTFFLLFILINYFFIFNYNWSGNHGVF